MEVPLRIMARTAYNNAIDASRESYEAAHIARQVAEEHNNEIIERAASESERHGEIAHLLARALKIHLEIVNDRHNLENVDLAYDELADLAKVTFKAAGAAYIAAGTAKDAAKRQILEAAFEEWKEEVIFEQAVESLQESIASLDFPVQAFATVDNELDAGVIHIHDRFVFHRLTPIPEEPTIPDNNNALAELIENAAIEVMAPVIGYQLSPIVGNEGNLVNGDPEAAVVENAVVIVMETHNTVVIEPQAAQSVEDPAIPLNAVVAVMENAVVRGTENQDTVLTENPVALVVENLVIPNNQNASVGVMNARGVPLTPIDTVSQVNTVPVGRVGMINQLTEDPVFSEIHGDPVASVKEISISKTQLDLARPDTVVSIAGRPATSLQEAPITSTQTDLIAPVQEDPIVPVNAIPTVQIGMHPVDPEAPIGSVNQDPVVPIIAAPVIVVQHSLVIPTEEVRVLDAQAEDPAAIGQEDPVAIGQEDPVAIGQENPVAIGQEDPVAIGQENPVAIGQEDSVAIGQEDPVITNRENRVDPDDVILPAVNESPNLKKRRNVFKRLVDFVLRKPRVQTQDCDKKKCQQQVHQRIKRE